jgi:Protein of unknown function (DUF3102)
MLDVVSTNEVALAEHAAMIKALGRRVVRDVIEIGRRLIAAKVICREENERWLPWLEREFGWDERQARRYMEAYRAFMQLRLGKPDNLSDLEIPVSSLKLLAAPTTPVEVREAVIEAPQPADTKTWRRLARRDQFI